MAAWGARSNDTTQVDDTQACRWTGERSTVLGGHLMATWLGHGTQIFVRQHSKGFRESSSLGEVNM